ncbi:MAG: MFS transporter [Deltaproteobacteria bacterium]|nr:MFS transporter [Deltaproteobacteria bacterium]
MNFKLLYCLGIGLGLGIATMNLPPAMDILAAHYRIDYLGLSSLISALFWSHALLQLPGGLLSDRLGLKRSLGVGLSLAAAGNLAGALGGPLSWALFCRVVTGMGTGITYVAGLKLAALESSAGRAGVSQAYFGGSLALGSIVSFLLLPCLAALDWRWPYWLPAGTSLLLLLGILMLPGASGSTAPAQWRGLAKVLVSPTPLALGLVHSLSWGSIITLGNWIPALIADSFHSTATGQYSWVGAAAMGLSGIARGAGGYALAGIRPKRVALGSMLVVAAIYLGLFCAPGTVPTIVLLLLAVITISVNFAAIFQLAYQYSEPAWLGGTLGMINLIANLGAIFLTILLGWVREGTGEFTTAFGVMSLLGVAIFAFSRALLRRGAANLACRNLPDEAQD